MCKQREVINECIEKHIETLRVTLDNLEFGVLNDDAAWAFTDEEAMDILLLLQDIVADDTMQNLIEKG